MKRITRNIIMDLIPLYLAGEASDDTRMLVEEYLETDKELAEMTKQTATFDLPKDIPVPLEKDGALKLYIEAKRQMTIRMGIIAASILFVLMFMGALIVLLTGV
ncbi:MAG TPA: hypothetical protein VJ972_10005 [Anaerolineales bacterium]|nr:hypothetical protein [Anaerolineales bacterium]